VTKTTWVQLPQLCGNGYYSYSQAFRQYGTATAIETLLDVARSFAWTYPQVPIGIGDISFKGGGVMPPHVSHTNGRSVDIRPVRNDGKQGPILYTDTVYSRERTAALVALFLAHRNVKLVLFNDEAIPGVRYAKGHNNHLHVAMRR
jgi:hypothetical protein